MLRRIDQRGVGSGVRKRRIVVPATAHQKKREDRAAKK